MARRLIDREIVRPAVLLAAGTAVVAVALGPALHRAADELFSAHMVQHLLLVTVASPLLVAAAPGPAHLRWAPRVARRSLGRRIGHVRRILSRRHMVAAIGVWLVHVAVLWAWHVPALYEAALRTPALHAIEHASLLATAMAFWAVLLRHPPGPVTAVLLLFAAAGQSTALGALLTLATEPSFPGHARTVAAWGLTPLEDQQLAGAVMWVVGGLGYLWAGLAILARVLAPGRRQATTDAPRSASICALSIFSHSERTSAPCSPSSGAGATDGVAPPKRTGHPLIT
jgi:putative membrane protein